MNSAPLPTVSAYMVMLWQYGVAKLRQSDVLSTIQHNKGIKIVDTQWRNFTTGYLLRLIALNIFMEKTTICYCDYQNHRPYIVLKRRNSQQRGAIPFCHAWCLTEIRLGIILYAINRNDTEEVTETGIPREKRKWWDRFYEWSVNCTRQGPLIGNVYLR